MINSGAKAKFVSNKAGIVKEVKTRLAATAVSLGMRSIHACKAAMHSCTDASQLSSQAAWGEGAIGILRRPLLLMLLLLLSTRPKF